MRSFDFFGPEAEAARKAFYERQALLASHDENLAKEKRRKAFNAVYSSRFGDAWRVVARHVYLCCSCNVNWTMAIEHCLRDGSIWKGATKAP